MKINTLKNIGITTAIWSLAVLTGLLFQELNVRELITAVFVFAVFLISLLTDRYIYGIVSSLAAIMAINYVFTYPFFALNFIIPANLISALIMTAITILTGTLTTKIKMQEAIKMEGERERMRANLLRAVSHDLRTPLTAIYGASSALLENKDEMTEEQQDTVLRGIQEDSEWLIRVVENLLSVTRISSGKVKIAKTSTVLDELIDSVMIKFSKRYPQQEVRLDIPDDIVVVPMDAILIEQVITNMLENAVLHAKGMTVLTLRAYPLGRRIIFEIEDNGCGIPKDRLAMLFSGHYESPSDTADGCRRNFGIGLAVCAAIVKAHGGEIRAENKKSGGAVFRFSLDMGEKLDDE